MKVLFINKFLDKEAIYRDPLGIMTLAAMVRPKHEVFVIEPVRENIEKRMDEIQPDVIAYSLRTGYHRYYIDLNLKLKKNINLFLFLVAHMLLFILTLLMKRV